MKRPTFVLLGLFTTTLALLTACGGAATEPTATASEIATASKESGPSISEQKTGEQRAFSGTAQLFPAV